MFARRTISTELKQGGGKSRGRVALAALCLLVVVLLLGLLVRFAQGFFSHQIWINADIITMDGARPAASAIGFRRGVIEFVGSSQNALETRRWYTRVRDLEGKTVMPGIVDAHSHFPAGGLSTLGTDLSPPPAGSVDSLDALYKALARDAGSDTESLLLGFNYDNASLQEGVHPTREGLDKVSTTRPIYAYHSSGHMGVANSKALELLGRKPEDFPDGLMQERMAPSLSELISDAGVRKLWEIFGTAKNDYLEQGITTANNGATPARLGTVLKVLAHTPLLPMRIVINPLIGSMQPDTAAAGCATPERLTRANQRFVCGTAKVIVDGSPQGFTAFLSQPYHSQTAALAGAAGSHVHKGINSSTVHKNSSSVPGEYRGSALYTAAELNKIVSDYHQQGWQLSLHGNGDAAMDLILDAMDAAGINAGDDARHVLIHAQTARQDQIMRMKALGVTPSFFVSHVYFWGDWHSSRVLGPERVQNISPTGWALQSDLKFTLHTDAPVTAMRPFDLISYSMLRQSRGGKTLGAHHRLDIEQALRALTIDAAWQIFLDKQLGSLVEDKFADLLVLSESPLRVSVDELKDIQVLETVIAGKRVFQREADRAIPAQ